ncbi:uncharacterized protein LOC121375010 [Gigantopelta aegis]|uniref:uncharacterized protein LOC121375010 n=1 Tax=Gigantopelta aegis TaxID=1735272 RepID=UPI001B88BC43|nr:uncharacterized protein LOC121375010 [Gigantopelta aegis]
MSQRHHAPKQLSLTKVETVNSFENWCQNIMYTLSLDPYFSRFLADRYTWNKKSHTEPMRGFADDVENIPVRQSLTAQHKSNYLDLMLGQIANYYPIISRNTIIKTSTSLPCIWQSIHLHFGFLSTGGHFIDFDDIQLQPEERSEELFQHLTAFVEDHLLAQDSAITHHGDHVAEDEEMSPSLENFIVLQWLRLIKQRILRHYQKIIQKTICGTVRRTDRQKEGDETYSPLQLNQ